MDPSPQIYCPEARCAMEIRRAVPNDAESLAALWIRSRAASVPSIPPSVHSSEEVHRWFKEEVVPSFEVWVADVGGGDITGLIALDNEWIDQLYVDQGLTGRGIGGVLLAQAMRLRPTGLKLWTFQSNHRARRFYETHGFVATASTTGNNEEVAPDVCYEWRPARGLVPPNRHRG
jgi:GNAT superfamily N-acetyltransferase